MSRGADELIYGEGLPPRHRKRPSSARRARFRVRVRFLGGHVDGRLLSIDRTFEHVDVWLTPSGKYIATNIEDRDGLGRRWPGKLKGTYSFVGPPGPEMPVYVPSMDPATDFADYYRR